MRAAVAVELVHSATLVHDDVIDGAQLRRGRPTVAAGAGRAGRDRHRRPAVLARVCRARAQRRSGPAARALGRQLGARRGRAAPARGCLRVACHGRALPETLRAEDRRAVRSRLPPRRARGGGARVGSTRARGRARRVCPADRVGLPDAGRRARRVRAGRAHRQVTRHGPARRHRHAAADPRARARRRACRIDLAARCGGARPERRSCATGSPPPARWTQARERALALVAEAKAALPASLPAGRRRCWSWWPTRSSSATRLSGASSRSLRGRSGPRPARG